MPELPINANIVETNGTFYPVRLEWVPRKGELIELQSYIDMEDKRPSLHRYEVLQVVHNISDLTKKVRVAQKGSHFVTVHVKRTQNKFFATA